MMLIIVLTKLQSALIVTGFIIVNGRCCSKHSQFQLEINA